MDILTKDIERKETQSNTGPTLNSSSGFLRITNQNGKRISKYTINSMKLSKEALHYIVNEYPYIWNNTVNDGDYTYLSYFLNISKIIN